MAEGYKLRKIIQVPGRRVGIGLQKGDLEFYDDAFYDRATAFEYVAQDQPPDPFDDGLCYDHAREMTLANPDDLHYVDGLAGIFEGEQDCGQGWGKCDVYSCVPHAWCVNKKGEVVDPSWDAKDNRFYFGIPIPLEDVRAHQADRDSPNPRSKRPVLSLEFMSGTPEKQEAGVAAYDRWLKCANGEVHE